VQDIKGLQKQSNQASNLQIVVGVPDLLVGQQKPQTIKIESSSQEKKAAHRVNFVSDDHESNKQGLGDLQFFQSKKIHPFGDGYGCNFDQGCTSAHIFTTDVPNSLDFHIFKYMDLSYKYKFFQIVFIYYPPSSYHHRSFHLLITLCHLWFWL
jgi:hypothetical protein